MTESVPGCLGNYPKPIDGNKCAFCDPELKLQCRVVAENKPKTERKQ